MDSWTEYAKFLVGLLAIVNPTGAIPIFIGLTTGQSARERHRTGLLAAVSAGVVLMVTLVAGESLLHVFGIGIASFRVGGGILILLMSISMMHARVSPAKQVEQEAQEAADKDSVAVVPLGIPLLAGPGAIGTVILYTQRDTSLVHHLVLGGGVLVVVSVAWLSFRLAPFVASLLGKTGINVFTRIMGLIIAAIGVEFIASGLKQLLPGLA